MKKTRQRKQRAVDEVTPDEAREALDGEWRLPVLKLSELRRKIRVDPMPTKDATRQIHVADEVRQDPEHFLVVTQEGDLLERPLVLVDLLAPEAIEISHRSTRLLNSLSMAGVQWVSATPDAEAWLRSRLSGRRMKSDETVV